MHRALFGDAGRYVVDAGELCLWPSWAISGAHFGP